MDIAQIEQLVEIIDSRLLANSLCRPLYHIYLRFTTIHIQVLRLLTELMLLWSEGYSKTVPSLSRTLHNSLASPSSRAVSQSVAHKLWKVVIDALYIPDPELY